MCESWGACDFAGLLLLPLRDDLQLEVGWVLKGGMPTQMNDQTELIVHKLSFRH